MYRDRTRIISLEGLVRTLFGGDTDRNTEGKYFNYAASGLRWWQDKNWQTYSILLFNYV